MYGETNLWIHFSRDFNDVISCTVTSCVFHAIGQGGINWRWSSFIEGLQFLSGGILRGHLRDAWFTLVLTIENSKSVCGLNWHLQSPDWLTLGEVISRWGSHTFSALQCECSHGVKWFFLKLRIFCRITLSKLFVCHILWPIYTDIKVQYFQRVRIRFFSCNCNSHSPNSFLSYVALSSKICHRPHFIRWM